MKFIDVAIPKFGDDEAQHEIEPVQRPAAPDRHPHRSFRQRPIEEYTLDDNRSITSAKTADEKDEETLVDEKGADHFYEAQDDSTEAGLCLSLALRKLTIGSHNGSRCSKRPSNSPSRLDDCKPRCSNPRHRQLSVPLQTLFSKVSVSLSICESMICRWTCSSVLLRFLW